jgi:hypothetical protein
MDDPLQRRDAIRGDVDQLGGEQRSRIRGGVAGSDGQLVQIDAAADINARLSAVQREAQLQIGRQPAAVQRHRQRFRRIGVQLRQIQVVQPDRHVGLAALREWTHAAGDVQRAAVDARAQQRLHEYLHVGRQIGNERNADLQVVDRVLLTGDAIIEIDAAVIDADV